MVSEWQHTQDVMAYKNEIYYLNERIHILEEIEKDHKKLNGALRTELSLFYKTVSLSEGENPYDDFPDECILCGTKLEEIETNRGD